MDATSKERDELKEKLKNLEVCNDSGDFFFKNMFYSNYFLKRLKYCLLYIHLKKFKMYREICNYNFS